jgi:RNA polymerase sigma-70 factor, ECF subfamily
MLATKLLVRGTIIGIDTRTSAESKNSLHFPLSIRRGSNPSHASSMTTRRAIGRSDNEHPQVGAQPCPRSFQGIDMNSTISDLIQSRLPQWRAYAQALTHNRSAAEDLVQDTVVRVLKSIDRFDGTNFRGWSNTILHNRFIDDRRRARFQGGSIEDLPVAVTAQKATQEREVELGDTMRALDEISPKHREIIVLIGIKELSYAQTARQLKIPVGTVRSRLARARAELLTFVEGEHRLDRADGRRRSRRRGVAAEGAAAGA